MTEREWSTRGTQHLKEPVDRSYEIAYRRSASSRLIVQRRRLLPTIDNIPQRGRLHRPHNPVRMEVT